MINKNEELCFIDLDASIIDEYVSSENIYYTDGSLDISEKKEKTRNDDKVGLFAMYVAYLVEGEFMRFSDMHIDIRKTGIDYETQREINAYINELSVPSNDYYFEDIVDNLISKGYESPNCKVKRMK